MLNAEEPLYVCSLVFLKGLGHGVMLAVGLDRPTCLYVMPWVIHVESTLRAGWGMVGATPWHSVPSGCACTVCQVGVCTPWLLAITVKPWMCVGLAPHVYMSEKGRCCKGVHPAKQHVCNPACLPCCAYYTGQAVRSILYNHMVLLHAFQHVWTLEHTMASVHTIDGHSMIAASRMCVCVFAEWPWHC